MNIQSRYYRAVEESVVTVVLTVVAVAVVGLALAHFGNWLVESGFMSTGVAEIANLAHTIAIVALWVVPVGIYLRARWRVWSDE